MVCNRKKTCRILARVSCASVCLLLLVTFSAIRNYNLENEKALARAGNTVLAPAAKVQPGDYLGNSLRNFAENEIPLLDQGILSSDEESIFLGGIRGVDRSKHETFYNRVLLWLKEGNKSHIDAGNIVEPKSSDNVECDDVHSLNSSEICVFVTSTPNCQNDQGFLSYTSIVYCTFVGRLLPLGVVLLFLWWLFLFVGLAVTADDFFCPALKVISKTLRLSDNIAGVTFLAFGNGAPDIFSAIAAVGNAKNGDAGLAFGALFGAGVFVTSAVAGTIAIICPFDAMQRPFLRDVIFYLAAVFWAFAILWDKTIEQYEAVGFILLYVIYVITVVVGRYIYQRHKRFKRVNSITNNTNPSTSIQSGTDRTDPYNQSNEVADSDDELKAPITGSASFFANRRVYVTRPSEEESVENSIATEGTPLLGKYSSAKKKYLLAFLKAINPINVAEWREKRFYSKFYEIFKCPIQLLLLLTVPVVEMSEEDRNWCRYLQALQLITGPVFASFATKVGFINLNGVFPVWGLVLIIGTILAVIVLCTSRNDTYPVYQPVFGFLGFLIAVIWIYCIANEVVNILQTFGVVFNISDAILGLTLLAWGNSVGDFIADTVMARQGFPRMGISACFGGPMFNLLLGIGIPFTIEIIKQKGSFKLQVTLEEYVLAGFLGLSLLVSLIMVPLSKFRMSRPYGITLWILYIVFLVTAILTETGVIHAEV